MRSAKDSEASDRARGFLARATSRAALPYLAVGLLLIVAIVAGGREIEHHISAIESWITKLGPWGVVAFVGLFVLSTSFLLPDTVLCIIAGALFGLGWGFAAALAGSVLAGAIQFTLSHKLLRGLIQRTLTAKASLAAIQRAVCKKRFGQTDIVSADLVRGTVVELIRHDFPDWSNESFICRSDLSTYRAKYVHSILESEFDHHPHTGCPAVHIVFFF